MAYVDEIYESFKFQFRSSKQTKQQWLDGDHGWRSPLRQIGELAKRITDIRNISVARLEWARTVHGQPWIRDYLLAVPLLDVTATKADHDNETFVKFMQNLATLANL